MAPRLQSAFVMVSAAHGSPRLNLAYLSLFHDLLVKTDKKMPDLRLRAAPVLPDEALNVEGSDNDNKLSKEISQVGKKFSQHDGVEEGDKSPPKKVLEALTRDAPPLSIFLLNLVAIIWGSQHAVIKMVVQDSQAGPFTLLRFGLAALIASPYTPGLSKLKNLIASAPEDDKEDWNAWRWGAEMGMWMFLGFSFQAIGLNFTTAQRSGFLLYLNVKFVPFFARVLFGRDISWPTWISAFTAFLGTALLALDGSSVTFNQGDVWTIAAAMSSAMFILRLEDASKQVPDSAQLNAACLWVVTILAAVWSFVQGTMTGNLSTLIPQLITIASSHPLELVYLSGVTTALANYIQTKAQKDVSAERASVVYSLDPVYGAAFAWLLLGENLGGPQAYLGAGLITVAAATNAFLDFGKKVSSSSREND